MGARKIGKVVVFGMVGLTLLLAGTAPVAAQGLAPGKAMLVVYNAGAERALDADLVWAGQRQQLAVGLRPDESALQLAVPAGAAKLEVRLAGQGKGRLVRQLVRLRAGKVYCLIAGGAERLQLKDVSRHLRADPSPEKVCRELAR